MHTSTQKISEFIDSDSYVHILKKKKIKLENATGFISKKFIVSFQVLMCDF